MLLVVYRLILNNLSFW